MVPYCSCCCCAKFVPCHKNILDQRRLSGKYKGKPATEWNERFISVLLLWFYSLSICFPLSSDFCQEKLDSAPDCPSPRRKLKTNPPPRGFEEFFAKLATDPLVKVLGLEKTCEFWIVLNTFFEYLYCKHLSSVACWGGLKALSVFLVATFMAFAGEKVSLACRVSYKAKQSCTGATGLIMSFGVAWIIQLISDHFLRCPFLEGSELRGWVA